MSTDLLKRNIIFYSIIAVIIIGIYSYKSYRKMDFQRNSEQLAENAYKLSILSSAVYETISEVWLGYDRYDQKRYFDTKTGRAYSIYDDISNGIKNDLVYCHNTSEIILQQEQYFISMGVIDLMNRYKKNMDEEFAKIHIDKNRFENAYNNLQTMYNNANLFYVLATTPNGSIDGYISTHNEIYNNLDKTFNRLTYDSHRGRIEIDCPIFKNKREEYQNETREAFMKMTGLEFSILRSL